MSRAEIARYLAQHRPHEAPSALDLYDHYFNEPRITLTEVEDALVSAGFEILAWKDIQHAPHTALLTAEVLADCRREFPKATWRDLLTHDTTFVVRRHEQVAARGRPLIGTARRLWPAPSWRDQLHFGTVGVEFTRHRWRPLA